MERLCQDSSDTFRARAASAFVYVSVYGGGHKSLRGSGRRDIVEARCVARRPCWTYCRSGYVADLWVQVALNVFTLEIHSQLFPKSEATRLRVSEPQKVNILPSDTQ